MYIYLILIIGVLIFIVLVKELNLFSGSKGKERLPYRLRSYFFNKSEAAFFLELNNSLPPNFHIFPKVRMIDFIEPTNHEYKWRNKIWSRHVDFLICDQYFKPITAIEINGGYHNTTKQQERDGVKKEILESALIPLISVNVGADFISSVELIKTSLNKAQ